MREAPLAEMFSFWIYLRVFVLGKTCLFNYCSMSRDLSLCPTNKLTIQPTTEPSFPFLLQTGPNQSRTTKPRKVRISMVAATLDAPYLRLKPSDKKLIYIPLQYFTLSDVWDSLFAKHAYTGVSIFSGRT